MSAPDSLEYVIRTGVRIRTRTSFRTNGEKMAVTTTTAYIESQPPLERRDYPPEEGVPVRGPELRRYPEEERERDED